MTKGFPVNVDAGLLAMRLIMAVNGVFHGGQKLFGLFHGPGLQKTAEMFGHMFPLPTASAVAAGSAEFFGGVLLALGLFSRISSVFWAFTMFVAVFAVHFPNGYRLMDPSEPGKIGYEFPLTLAVILVGFVISGPGKYAVTPRL